MMSQRPISLENDPVRNVAEQCLTHLQLEAALLEQAGGLLEQLRSAILDRNPQELADAAARQAQAGGRIEQIAARRRALRESIAEALGIAVQAATLSRLLTAVPPSLQGPLEMAGRQVAELARDVDRKTRANAMLIHTQLELLDQVLSCLTGTAPSASRYTAGGHVQPQPGGSMFETRC